MIQIIYAGLALTMPPGKVETDYAVAVEGGRVVAAGDRATLFAQYPDAERFGGREYLLMPGFVNAHDHGRAIGSASLGIEDDILECWLPHLGAQPSIPPYLAAAYDGIQQLKSGITGTAHSHNPASWEGMPDECPLAIKGYRDAGIRVAFHPPMIDQNTLVYADQDAFIASLPPELQADARARATPPSYTIEAYIALCDDLYTRFHDAENDTVHIQISPAGGQWCSDDLIMASVEWAKRRETRVQMHMLETKYQRMYAYRAWGKSFIRHLEDIGALGDWLTLAHMVWADKEDAELLRERRVGIAHNPSSNLRLSSGIAHMFDFFSRFAIGLDGHTLDDDQDMWRELRLAWTLMRYNEGSVRGMSKLASYFLERATFWAEPMTFGLNSRLEPLTVGAAADLQLIDFDAVRGAWSPDGIPEPADVPAFLLHRANKSHVRHVMVVGRWCVQDGACVTLDEALIAGEIRAALAAQDRAVLRERNRAADKLTPHIKRFYRAWEK